MIGPDEEAEAVEEEGGKEEGRSGPELLVDGGPEETEEEGVPPAAELAEDVRGMGPEADWLEEVEEEESFRRLICCCC